MNYHKKIIPYAIKSHNNSKVTLRLHFGKASAQIAAYHHRRQGNHKPQHRKRQAYLTEKVEHHSRIVPHSPVKPQIYYAACDKFKHGYDYRPEQALHQQRLIGSCGVASVHYQQTQASRNRHTPMCKASERNLNQRIDYPSQKKYNKIFNSSRHCSFRLRRSVPPPLFILLNSVLKCIFGNLLNYITRKLCKTALLT